eukprot:4953305-Alexandrium_andersonii.AAC.1
MSSVVPARSPCALVSLCVCVTAILAQASRTHLTARLRTCHPLWPRRPEALLGPRSWRVSQSRRA